MAVFQVSVQHAGKRISYINGLNSIHQYSVQYGPYYTVLNYVTVFQISQQYLYNIVLLCCKMKYCVVLITLYCNNVAVRRMNDSAAHQT